MKKFNFRLAVVERHRKLKEQEKQVVLARSLEKMKATEKKLLEIDKQEVRARKEFARLGDPSMQSEVSTAKFWVLDRFIEGQKYRRIELKQKLADEELTVQHSYREFLKARQQKKIMEKLREKEEEKHKQKIQEKEIRVQDEHYVTRDAFQKNRKLSDGGSHE